MFPISFLVSWRQLLDYVKVSQESILIGLKRTTVPLQELESGRFRIDIFEVYLRLTLFRLSLFIFSMGYCAGAAFSVLNGVPVCSMGRSFRGDTIMHLLNVGEIGLEFCPFLDPLVILLPIPASASVDGLICWALLFLRLLGGTLALRCSSLDLLD